MPEKLETLADLKCLLGPELAKYVSFQVKGPGVAYAVTTQYLSSKVWNEINQVMRQTGGQWVSGRGWEIPIVGADKLSNTETEEKGEKPPSCEGCTRTGPLISQCKVRLYEYYANKKECPRERELAKAKGTLPVSKAPPASGFGARGTQSLAEKPTEFQMAPIDAILSMPFQSRLEFNEEEIAELAESIKVHGVLEPLLVIPKPDGLFELVAGERRLRASRKAGLTQVPVLVRKLSDQEALECHFIENLQRKDLNDYEKARMLNEMIQRFGYSHAQLAVRIGLGEKGKSWVTHHLQILELERRAVSRDTIEKLTESHVREILQAPPEIQGKLADVAAEGIEGERLSTRETRQLVDAVKVTSPEDWDLILTMSEEELAKKRREREKKEREAGKPSTPPPTPALPEEKLEREWKRRQSVKPIDFEAKGKLCPVCGRVINEELYEELKAKYASFEGLFK